LGLFFEDAEDLQDHNISLVIGNARTGQWLKRSPFDNPYILATQIDSWVKDFNGLGLNTTSYSDAPLELPRLSEGQLLFRSRCSVCHQVGIGDGRERIGPDLAGVTERRTRDWLRRFIMEPDKMLEEKDPTATQLFLAYGRIPMPNLGIPLEEADALIDFLEVEGRRAARIEGNEELRKRVNDVAPECCQKEDVTVVTRDDETAAKGAPEEPGAPGSWNLLAAGALAMCGLVTARGGRRRSA
ncbi:MAG: cytochrome c, partial [Planctomycetota bacterium]|nr:cytochrome c [Planctomycetota bacterium]